MEKTPPRSDSPSLELRADQDPLLIPEKKSSLALSPKAKARLQTAAKVGIALLIIAALVGAGALTLHKTIGFQATGQAIARGWHSFAEKTISWLHSGDFNVKKVLCIFAGGLGVGFILTTLGIQTVKAVQNRVERGKAENVIPAEIGGTRVILKRPKKEII